MPRIKPIELGLSKGQIEAVGLFTAQWSFLETEIEFTLSCLGMNVDGDQSVPFPFDGKIERWKKLARAHYGHSKGFAYSEHLISEAKGAQKFRSIIAHGRLEGDPTGRRKAISVEHNRHRKAGWHVQPYDFTVREVTKWATEIGRLSAKLIKFNSKNLPGMPSSLPRRYNVPLAASQPHNRRRQDNISQSRIPQLLAFRGK